MFSSKFKRRIQRSVNDNDFLSDLEVALSLNESGVADRTIWITSAGIAIFLGADKLTGVLRPLTLSDAAKANSK
jgi:hypothetical protein